MLDSDTKRRIDTARDILVGKVPDPKSQVEQITIALIYKFMDDLDAESEELGGERKFFADDFAKYGWAKLNGPGIGGYETLNLYAEAITRMPENPGIPPLFRNIFNNAYLPYRDPETLRSFLKIIDEFTYDHSERLGDAFEYLLSVLGSQGDAGQFRTPRHIIDFIVAVIDPKKDEVVLDPACGTAGFLISAYKHILAANTNSDGYCTLTPDARGQLVSNFRGYDISPDMVRLSLVNMYLHGFREPHIHEYDTLTSEDRWNEYADVILANPPFMSPKGGIRPHNRFSVHSKRSEVLFVDYMAEHLTANGRGGIIVPEGIIFQSQTAYRQLRKMLVEDYLVAVVSLPVGVFNPYSGVKTSILILDRALARRTDTIAFFKVENDGFDLGAQRRPIERNDLPKVQDELGEYLSRLRAGEAVGKLGLLAGRVVAKEMITADGEYNLSGERYRENDYTGSYIWPMVKIRDVCDVILSGGTPSTKHDEFWQGDIPWITSADIRDIRTAEPRRFITQEAIENSATNLIPKGNVVVVTRVGLGKLFTNDFDVCISQDSQGLILKAVIDPLYLTHSLRPRVADFKNSSRGSTIQGVTKKQLAEIQVPLPPPEAQKAIVEEIDGYQKIIDGALAVVQNYRPHIVIDPAWPLVSIQELAKPQYGFTASAQGEGDTRFIRITDISEEGVLRSEERKFIDLTSESKQLLLERGDILVARTGATYGKTMLFDEDYPAVFASYLIRLRFPPDRVHPYFYWAFAQSDNYWDQARALMTGGGQPQFNGNAIKHVKLPLPSPSTQRSIVNELKAEQAIIKSNWELIRRFEGKIQAAIARVWGRGTPTNTGD